MKEAVSNQSSRPGHKNLGKRRSAGVLVPLFSLRREDGLGIGDVKALREFIDWAAELGLGFVQLLPINETGADHSPYNAISSVALDPLSLDCSPEALPDLNEKQYERVISSIDEDLLHDGKVHYEMVRLLKTELLWRSFQVFFSLHYRKDTERDVDFHTFCDQEQKWLADYCLFRLLMDMEGGKQNWQEWDDKYNTIHKARGHLRKLLSAEPVKTERQLVFYAYIQWIAQKQWGEIRNYAESKDVALMGDMPIGVALCSADVFANPQWFDMDWYGGAPPETNFKADEFTRKWGQNWGIPLFRWEEMEDDGYSWWRLRVKKLCEIFTMFRIDHTLGFFRIYGFPWNPIHNKDFLFLDEEQVKQKTGGRLPGFQPRNDDSEENCSANREDGMRYLKMIQDAAEDAVVIAEDLGVVPDYVRPALAELGIAGMKVPQWEVQEQSNDLVSGLDYPEVSFTTYASHDHPPLMEQWEEQRSILSKGQEGTGDYWEAWRFLHGLAGFAGIEWGEDKEGPAGDDAVRMNLLEALLKTNSRHAAILITDLLGLEGRINTPGLANEENWTWRLPYTASELSDKPEWKKIIKEVKKLLNDSNRVPSVSQDREDCGFYEI